MTAKFDGVCNVAKCGHKIKKGETIGYDMNRRKVYCRECLEQYERDLAADNFDLMANACM